MNDVTLGDRLFGRLVQDGECWRWTGPISGAGYGTISINGTATGVHRAVYEFMVGNVPHGLVLDHLCGNRWCANPWHLDPVTQSVNCLRGNTGAHHARKTHCPHGHPLDGVGKTQRYCKTCSRSRDAKRRAEKKRARAALV